MDRETLHRYALALHSGLSAAKVHRLLDAWCADGDRTVDGLWPGDPGRWSEAGLSPEQVDALERARKRLPDAVRELETAETAGLRVVGSDALGFPPVLAATLGAARPPLLFCLGNVELLRGPGVAVIGSRTPTPAAAALTRAAGAAFARAGLTVVSGFAEGVDRHASSSALEAGGSTVLVLAQGLLTFELEGKIFEDALAQGRLAAVSAFAPDAAWGTPRAMARNAMIVGWSRDVLVGQARASGGAWEASRMALRQGKRVWVLDTGLPESGHQALARLGAHVLAWPVPDFEIWIGEIAKAARAAHAGTDSIEPWTEAAALRLLATGSPAEIHDACGLTGRTLIRIVEGRRRVALRRLDDLLRIPGFGWAAVRAVARSFGLEPPRPEPAQLTLFPEEAPAGRKDRVAGA